MGWETLVIYSPAIEDKVVITDECYQMDIYPTILHLIGCDNYYWQGFGINLLADDNSRLVTEEEAFVLSDKMIKTNFFKTWKDKE